MFRFSLKSMAGLLFIVFIVLTTASGCVSTQTASQADAEKWTGKLSGMVEGDFELFIHRAEDQVNDFPISGRFEAELDSTAGGYGGGTLSCRLNGVIRNGNLKSTLSGFVKVDEGSSQISGKMTGTISDTHASGTWIISHVEGSHSGKWTAWRASE